MTDRPRTPGALRSLHVIIGGLTVLSTFAVASMRPATIAATITVVTVRATAIPIAMIARAIATGLAARSGCFDCAGRWLAGE